MAEPDREAIRAAVERIQRLSDEHWRALDPTCALMDDQAWVGPTGDRFGAEVQACRRELRALLTTAVNSARAKLAATVEGRP